MRAHEKPRSSRHPRLTHVPPRTRLATQHTRAAAASCTYAVKRPKMCSMMTRPMNAKPAVSTVDGALQERGKEDGSGATRWGRGSSQLVQRAGRCVKSSGAARRAAVSSAPLRESEPRQLENTELCGCGCTDAS